MFKNIRSSEELFASLVSFPWLFKSKYLHDHIALVHFRHWVVVIRVLCAFTALTKLRFLAWAKIYFGIKISQQWHEWSTFVISWLTLIARSWFSIYKVPVSSVDSGNRRVNFLPPRGDRAPSSLSESLCSGDVIRDPLSSLVVKIVTCGVISVFMVP